MRWLARLALAAVLAMPVSGQAAPPAEPGREALPLSSAQRATLAAHPVLRLGVESDWAPIEFIDERGVYSGVISSYMRAIEQSLGIRIEVVRKDTWSEVLKAFAAGEIDAISAMGVTEERRATMRFTQPYIRFTDGIIVRSNEPYIERLKDFPVGKRLAVVEGYGSSERAAASHPQLVVVPVRTTAEALLAVSTNRADIAVASLASAYFLTQNKGLSNLRVAANFDEYEQSMSMALRPELEALIPLLNTALSSIKPGEQEAMRAMWTRVPIDRGIAKRTVLIWVIAGAAALLLMAAWILWLLSRQRHARQLLQRAETAEAQFRAMIDAMPALFWTLRIESGRPAQFTFFGDRVITHTGFDLDETGTCGFDEGVRYMTAEDRQRIQQLLDQHGRLLTPLRFEHRLDSGPLEGRWAYVQALPRRLRNHIVWYGCTTDISARKSLEAALEQSRNQLAELAAGVPGALWQFRHEADGRQYYSYMSDGIVGITGRTPAETNQLMLDKSFVSVHPDDLPILKSLMQRLTEKPGIDEARYRLRTSDGGWKWVQVAAHAMPVGADGARVSNGITLDASRAHETEQALRFERQQLRDMADNLSGALWRLRRRSNGQFVVDYISEGVVGVLGYTAAKLMQAKVHNFDHIVEADRPLMMAALAASADTGQPLEIEYSVQTASGSIERLFARAAVRQEGSETIWTGVLLNVSERHRLQQQLADVRGRIEDIAANFPGAIFQMHRAPDGRARYTYVSEGITTLTGRPPRTQDGRESLDNLDNIFADDRAVVRDAVLRTLKDGGSTQFDYRLIHASGQLRWVHCALTARPQADGSAILNGLLLDAGEAKRLEAELRGATERAELANRAKTRFLSNMSHEIRTPMNAVIGLAHIAMTSETNPVQAERIGKIHRAGKALLKLLNDILEYSRLDAGKYTPVVAGFRLDELQEGLRLFCAPAAEAKGLRFTIDCSPDAPMHWRGDATRIQQVLLNLLTNAIKFTDAGSVTLLVQPIFTGTPGLSFEVRDTGIGMSADEVKRVFEAFEQASGEIERRHGGSGLGLSISRELVQALGGSITVQSKPGAGSVFSVSLPLQLGAATPAAAPQPDLDARLARLGEHLANGETSAARAALQALRTTLLSQGREPELHRLERLLAAFDFEAAQVELVQLRMRWRSPPR
ncbi:MAG: transporter substrate-binding domain-containing protein [Pseudomonadota bacterium]